MNVVTRGLDQINFVYGREVPDMRKFVSGNGSMEKVNSKIFIKQE